MSDTETGTEQKEKTASSDSSLSSSSSSTLTKSAPVARENDYEWGKTLGEGTFGKVKLGTVKDTGKTFAVKMIEKKFIMEKKNQAIVFREREILTLLGKHPFIVTLHYTFQNPTTLFFVMDYCANGELFNQLRKHGSFSLDVTRHYLAEIVSALEVIHGKGVMHRDLKPENILLTDTNHIKIIDFGTAKIVGRGRSGSFEGTPEYMSPELLINKECDVRCDLWSLGVMAYQFVTGQLPFRGSTPWETMRKVREREFEYPPKFPETVKDLCEHLLVADPEARLGSKGFDELKTHPFFVGVDWSCLPETTPPPFEPNPDFPKPAGMEPTRRKSNENSDDEFVSDDEASDRLTQSSRSLSGSSSTSTSLSHSSGSLPTVSAVDTAAWAQFLQGEEKIVRAGLVFKKRRAFNVKKRQLILTDAPRMLYVDPSSMKKMGEIPFSSISKAQVKDSAHFIISTKKGRAYNFEDKTKNAQKWVEAINNFL